METTNSRIVSRMASSGRMELWIEESLLAEPAADEVVVRIEGAPVNPADLLQLIGPADLSTLEASGTAAAPHLSARIAPEKMPVVAGRLDQTLATGNEGAGTVVRAGAKAGHLLGRVVAVRDGMYAQMRLAKAAECLVLPIGISARVGAAASINPFTALAMIETMRRDKHHALVHTAAASSVGQMLNRLCLKDGIELISVVRSSKQVELLKADGALHVLDSSQPGFLAELRTALDTTGATLAFDALGGGRMAGDILVAMESVLSGQAHSWSRYGSKSLKQVYLYGMLDRSPKLIEGNVGTAWAMSGWLMSWFMESIDAESVGRMRQRVTAEIDSTFATQFHREMTLTQALEPDNLKALSLNQTGAKTLLIP